MKTNTIIVAIVAVVAVASIAGTAVYMTQSPNETRGTTVIIDDIPAEDTIGADYSESELLVSIMNALHDKGGRIYTGGYTTSTDRVTIEKNSIITIYGDIIFVKDPYNTRYYVFDIHDIAYIFINT